MRYEGLSLPIGENVLSIRFHPRLTVLAGLTGPNRDSMIEAIASATSGAVPGATVQLVDNSNRHLTINPDASDETSPALPGPVRRVRNLLEVNAEELGLPRPSDDPSQARIQRQLVALRDQLEHIAGELRRAQAATEARDHLRDELNALDTILAESGTDADRYVHNRTKILVELESVRACLDAVDASPQRIARDEAMISSTVEIQELADAWASTSSKLDRLRVVAAHTDRLEPEAIADAVDVPDSIPATVTSMIRDHDRLVARCDQLQSELDAAMAAPEVSTPADSRVMVLSLLDQETLWIAHRDVLLATDALRTAEEEEQRLAMVDPGERTAIEHAHRAATDATTNAERRWLTGMLIATICACSAGTLALAGMFTLAIPVLLAVTLLSLGYFVIRPKFVVRAAHRREATLLAAVGATDLNEYLHRFNDDPESERWRRAEQLIDDYESSMAEWRYLVGHITPADASLLESQVHDWIEANDPAHRDASSTAVRRRLERAKIELTDVSNRLNTVLEPYGVTTARVPVDKLVRERVRKGQQARVQIELDDAIEVEGKLTRQLESNLEALGFESGNLASRIAAYGRELDAALERESLRQSVTDRESLVSRLQRLEAKLAIPAPVASSPAPDVDAGKLDAIRTQRAHLAQQITSMAPPDTSDLERRHGLLTDQVQALEASLSGDTALLVEHPVDHLVETLIGHRPMWPTTDHEVAPAILNDPFASLAQPVQRRLLEALGEIGKVTQIILLTDDTQVVEWARGKVASGMLELVAPGAKRS